MLEQSDYKIDRIDAALLEELQVNARIGVVELSRRLEIARGTVQTRIDRLVASGVIRGFTANLNLEAIGYHVKAYITVEVKEGQIDSVVDPLNQINEVVEVHSVAAQGDLLCLVVARSNQNLMEELKKVKRVIGKVLPGAPHKTLLVLDATIGQNSISQAKLFHEAMELDGLVMTKLDGTAKGGVLLNLSSELKLPVYFIGVGEKAEDLQAFDPENFVEALISD